MRAAGYLGALGQAGIQREEKLMLFASSFEECENWLKALLDRGELPTAIFAATDWLAVELMKIAGRYGLQIPRDLSVAGFDDSPWLAPVMNPPVTSVRVPIEEIGATAFRCLHEEIQQNGHPGSRIALPVKLMARASTAAPHPT
jgi:LacI family transcriptional regulator